MDVYGHGQIFGRFAVAYCRKYNIDIDKFRNAINDESNIFLDGMDDGIGGNRDSNHFDFSEFNSKNPI